MPRALPIAEQLRRAIKDAERRGMSRYAIAKAAGMGGSQLARIAKGLHCPTLDVAERVARAVKLKIYLGR